MRFSRSAARAACLLFSLSALAALGGCANKAPSSGDGAGASSGPAPIVLGEYGSMTGQQATFGSSTLNGCKLAIDEVNKAGGVDGHPLKLVSEDDEGKPDAALTVVKKLITRDKVTAIVGEVASKNTIAAAPFANTGKTPMVSPSSTNPKVTTIGPYIFRICFIDPFQGFVAAKFATQTLHAKRAAILTDATGDYSIGLSDAFNNAFTKFGGQVVTRQNYQAVDPDFRAQLTAIKATNPDVLFVPGYYNNVGVIAKQAREVGITVPLMGGDGWESPILTQGAGFKKGTGGQPDTPSALEGSYYTNHSAMDSPDPTIQNFVKTYKAAYGGEVPGALPALGHDSVMIIVDAMHRAGKPADGDYSSDAYRAKLRDALAATKDFKAVTGSITLDANRNAIKPAVVLQIKGQDAKYVATVNP